MNVSSTTAAAAAARLQNVSAAKAAYKPAAPTAPQVQTDKAEFSKTPEMDRLMQLAKGSEAFRADKVAALKAEIAAGTYDLDAKADTVADKMLDDMGL